MTTENFKQSLSSDAPPEIFSDLRKALWHAAKGNWNEAHNIAQSHEGEKDFDRLHAYLHRVEGDEWNAGYWYRRAGIKIPGKSTDDELKDLIEAF